LYEGKLASLIQNPRHVGDLSNPSGVGEVTNPVCDDRMRLSILVHDRIITNARFKVYGCAPAIATGSMAAELIQGKTIDDALRISRDDIAEAVGGLPNPKIHCATLAVDAIWAAVSDYQRRQRATG
jgi:nitrogen fixation NifU-like protein